MKHLILPILLPLIFCACAPQSNAPQPQSTVISNEPNQAPAPSPTPRPTHPNKRVLVIGDSISFGYTPFVAEKMPESDIVHIPMNSRNSYYTSQNVSDWLELYDKPFDAILWNNGMWNCIHGLSPEPGHPPDQPPENLFTSLEQYESDIRLTASKLIRTGSRIVFLTTTYIPAPQNGILEMGYERQLNEVAKRVLPEYGIEVFDIHPLSESLPAPMRMYGYDIHYTDAGSNELANFVVEALK